MQIFDYVIFRPTSNLQPCQPTRHLQSQWPFRQTKAPPYSSKYFSSTFPVLRNRYFSIYFSIYHVSLFTSTQKLAAKIRSAPEFSKFLLILLFELCKIICTNWIVCVCEWTHIGARASRYEKCQFSVGRLRARALGVSLSLSD